ncbi:MAG: LuxR C-terminal-related transcriptional regulator [Propionibacteriaceae bacterium]|jgi:LuxR family transcriptional regulator, maltose regulon positive regulatory protein
MADVGQSVLAETYPEDVRGFPLSVVPYDYEQAQATRALVKSLVIPRILAGGGGDTVQLIIEQKEFGESEPLLLAGAALARSWIDIAELALARAGSELAQTAGPDIPGVLSLALLNVATSRLRDDPALGLVQAQHVRDLMTELTASQRARSPELSPLIDYYVAGFELSRGNLSTARWTLERGAGRFRQWLDGDENHAEQLIRAACAGQLAWLDAVCGDQRRATRYAASLLTDRRADSGETGVVFAHLTTAWTHLERGEIDQAAQRLDHAQSRNVDNPDPLLAASERLSQVRLALASGEPETALRLLESPATTDQMGGGWFADQFQIATAEAWLAAGEPQQAIASLAPEPELAAVEAKLILVRALRLAGDPSAAREVFGQVHSDPVLMSIINQVRRWLLHAELAIEQGNRDQAELLLDRALGVATREQLRATVSWAGPWLQSFVARDSALSRRHAAFLASVPQAATSTVDHWPGETSTYDGMFVVPLTARETDVLKLLAQLCTNEEIAADLVLSLNTVKTHMRSLFQKLSVTRRADAVRRGRTLGLC